MNSSFKMNNTALLYALGTVITWGLYSVLLHKGSLLMNPGGPPDTGSRMKAFLLVGVAYFIVGIIGPLVVMKARGVTMNFPAGGLTWSLLAGIAGAVGAFFLLMALSSGKGADAKSLVLLVPAIVFAGAPVVNAAVSITKDRLWGETGPLFYLGILLAAAGVALVMQFRPLGHAPAKPSGPAVPADSPAPAKTAAVHTVPETPVAAGYLDVTTRTWSVS